MIAVVTWRVVAGGRPAFRACMLGAMLFGVAMPGVMTRRWIAPISEEVFASTILPAAFIAFIAAWLGAVAATACWEVRSCTYSWNVPRLLRGMNREMLVLGVAIVCFAVGVGATLHGSLVNASWSPAIAAALGYAAGASFMMPRGRIGGSLALLAVMGVFAALPEIDWLAARVGPFGALAATGVMMAVVIRADRNVAARDRLDARAPWLEAAGPDARLYGRKAPFAASGTDAAGEFQGVRRSDGDWLRALIHEVHGETRRGLGGTAARWAAVMLVMGIVVQWYQYLLRSKLPGDVESTFLSVAVVMSMMVISAPVLPVLGANRPLSRRRLAWLLWLRTQVEEAAVLGAVLITFAAAAVVMSLLVAGDVWTPLGWWTQTLLATFALLPFARFIRLRTIDVDARVMTSNGGPYAGGPFTGGVLLGQVGTMFLLRFGAWGIVAGWHELMLHLATLPPVATIGACAGAALVAAAIRWWWLAALRRFLERRDLVVA